jgi:hypothetical protein
MSWERVAAWSASVALAPVTGGLSLGIGPAYEMRKKKSDKKEAQAAEAANATSAVTTEARALDQEEADRKGRLALISTTPEGVFGTTTTGRNKLLGN